MTQLLPAPKNLASHEGVFELDSNTLFLIPVQAGDELFFAASQLQEELLTSELIHAAIIKAYTPPRKDNVVLFICGEDQAIAFGVDPVPLAAAGAATDQAYALTVTPHQIVLYADTPTAVFYAVQTLRQLIRLHGNRLPALAIQDWPSLLYRGLMLDISRGKVPTMDTLVQLVNELSHFKLNVLQLYTEHTFRFPRHPLIGAGCGSLNSEDVMVLDAFCRAHHVELMPNLQSFGHARHTLTIPEYQHLAETDALWTLSPAFEETYTLLDELFADMLPAFTSRTFNIGCDETYDLGKGASREMADEVGLGRVYLDHILRVRELAARYGRDIQAWGDILLHHPELISEVPDDVTLLDWHYGPADAYPTAKVFAEAGRRFWVCPGVGSWNSLFPRLYGANVNIRNFVRDGLAAGAEGMLNTDWGDAGHYQYLGQSWYGYVFGAAQGWTGGVTSDEEFEAAFGPLVFGLDHEEIMEALHQLAQTNELPNVHRPNRSHTVLALFDEPLVGETVEGEHALPAATLSAMESLADAAGPTCYALAPGHPRQQTLREMASTARLTAFAARKTALAQAIRHTLREIAAQPETIQGEVQSVAEGKVQSVAAEQAQRLYDHIRDLKALNVELDTLRAEFEALWLGRARRSEIDLVLSYYASLHTRFRAAIAWLIEQREALLASKPLDPELTTYEKSGHNVLWHIWQDKSTW